MKMPEHIEIVEVSPRDGIQNERHLFTIDQKLDLIERAVEAGARRIEVGSFVREDRVPQMAGSEEVVARLRLPADVMTIGLVMNKKGLLRALETAIDEIGIVCIASDSFAMRNQGQTCQGSVEMACEMVEFARREGRRAQVTIGAAFGCPFEGEVNPDLVVAMARQLADAGSIEIALADTIGVAVPPQISKLVKRVREEIGALPVRVHLHNTDQPPRSGPVGLLVD